MPIDTTDLWPEPEPGPHPGLSAAHSQTVTVEEMVDDDGFLPFDAVPAPAASPTQTDDQTDDQADDETARLREATHHQIAVVLEELALEVEDLGGRLCTDMEVATRHMDVLQAVDLIAQKQRSLAKLLEADCPLTAIEQIGLDVLRDRLRMFH